MADNISSDTSIEDIELSDEEEFIQVLEPQCSPPSSLNSVDSIAELFSDSIADEFATSSDQITSSPNLSPIPSSSMLHSDKASEGSDVNDRLNLLSDDEEPKRSFEFHDSRLRTEALNLSDVKFRSYFRMSKETFYKLHEETVSFFPQGIQI